MVGHDEDLLRHVPRRMVGFLMHNHVGRISTPVEAQITLEPAGGVLGVDVGQKHIVVRCYDVTIGAFEPTFPPAGVDIVQVFVQLEMLLHEETVVGGESTRAGHALVQTEQTDFLEHAAAMFLVLGRDHVRPGLQPNGAEPQIGHRWDASVDTGTTASIA